jgi:hypothetical protein
VWTSGPWPPVDSIFEIIGALRLFRMYEGAGTALTAPDG